MSDIAKRVKEAIRPKPMCRDCADNDGRCPFTQELCDPNESAAEISDQVEQELETANNSITVLAEHLNEASNELHGASECIKSLGSNIAKSGYEKFALKY